MQGVEALRGHATVLQRGLDQGGVAADDGHGANMLLNRRGQRCEVLTFAVAAQDDHQLAGRTVVAQAVECGHGGTHIRALAVVEGIDSADRANELHAVRLTGVVAQAVQHGCERAIDGGCQRQCSQGIGGVVATAHAQRINGHEALDVQLFSFRVFTGTLDGLVRLECAHQPRNAVFNLQAEVTGMRRRAGAEAHHVARHGFREAAFAGHRSGNQTLHRRVVAVNHHHGVLAKHPRFGCCVGGHRAVPIKVVFAEVEHHGRVGLEVFDLVELEARQLQYPHIRKLVNADRVTERLQHRRADVAGHGHAFAGARNQQRSHRRGGGFAVGAGDGQHFGCVGAVFFQINQSAGKQVEFALHRQLGSGQRRGDALVEWRQAGAFQYKLDAFKAGFGQRPGEHHGAGHMLGQGSRLRCRAARVPHADHTAVRRTPTRHRQARIAQAEHQHVKVTQVLHQRNFKLATPTRHSNMVMIQKRTTTCVSFQPFFSK